MEFKTIPLAELEKEIAILEQAITVEKQIHKRYGQQLDHLKRQTKENTATVKRFLQLPCVVSQITEILESKKSKKMLIAKTILPVLGTKMRCQAILPFLSQPSNKSFKTNDLVASSPDTGCVFGLLPKDFDPKIKMMEVIERPNERFCDVGGSEQQIQELNEAIILPMKYPKKFKNLGIQTPKGVMFYGEPGTGKTLLARACAGECQCTFIAINAPQLVMTYIGDGAKMVRDIFELAKMKSPTIIFIDEIDAIGQKRSGEDFHSGEMIELLNQLDGFNPQEENIKMIIATNRPEILDPALIRSGRIDRKIELQLPNEANRERILAIHCSKLNFNKKELDLKPIAHLTDRFSGAMLKAVCIEAGMNAIRSGRKVLSVEDFIYAIEECKNKKRNPNPNLCYI